MSSTFTPTPEVDAVRSVTPCTETPFKMWFMAEDNGLTLVVNSDLKDAYNMPRQALPATYLQNACIDATRPSVIFEQQSMISHNIVGYVMEYNYDIDTELQLQAAQAAAATDSDRYASIHCSSTTPARQSGTGPGR